MTSREPTAISKASSWCGAQAKVLDDLELMRALAGFVEDRDEGLAAYSPTVVWTSLTRPAGDGRRCQPALVLTMSLLTGTNVTGRDSVIGGSVANLDFVGMVNSGIQPIASATAAA